MNEAVPTIPAAKNLLGNELIYRFLIRWPLWKSFHCVWAQVIGRLPHRNDGPLLCYMNHPSWWDGYISAIIHRHLLRWGTSNYVMMEEEQLRAYRFFTWAGAFSVHRQNAREALRSITYISRVLQQQPGRALYMFPQGEITPNDRRPLIIYPGLAHIAKRLGRAVLAPVALRYELCGEERPELFIRFGPLHHVQAPVDVHALTQEIQARLTTSVDALRESSVAGERDTFCVLLKGRSSTNTLFDRVSTLWDNVVH